MDRGRPLLLMLRRMHPADCGNIWRANQVAIGGIFLSDNGNVRLMDGHEALSGERDWAQLCLYSDGEPKEIDLTPAQLSAVSLVLGLCQGDDGMETLVGDELLEDRILPFLIEGISGGLWSAE